MPFVSIQLNSNRPAQVLQFFDSIESTADTPEDIEVLLHVDSHDDVMKQKMDEESHKRSFSLRILQTDLVRGYATLWKPLTPLFKLTHPDAYFVINLSDEMLFKTKGWDSIIHKYKSYYADDIFRLRASKYRFHNYTDFWECGYVPDSIAFYTRKWLELGEDWNPCLGPDSFQQSVAYYLYTSDSCQQPQYNRDIPLAELEFSGEGAGIGLGGIAKFKRVVINNRAWFVLMSHRMQQEAKRRAMRLKSHIIAFANGGQKQVRVEESSAKLTFNVIAASTGNVIAENSYRLSWLKISLINFYRQFWVFYYAGGGKRALRLPFIGCFIMICTYAPGGAYILNKSDEWRNKVDIFRKKLRQRICIFRKELKDTLFNIRFAGRIFRKIHHYQTKNRTPDLTSLGTRLDIPSIHHDLAVFRNTKAVLASIQIFSNSPDRILKLIENIESTADDPSRVELIVCSTGNSNEVVPFIHDHVSKHKMKLRYIHSDNDTNALFAATDANAYYIALLTDEARFETKGWDTQLAQYMGYYSDHVFRIRCSCDRFHNYTDAWECAYVPDNATFYTRARLAAQGGYGPYECHSSFQQCVSYYLFTADPCSHIHYLREVAAPFIAVSSPKEAFRFQGEGEHEWWLLVSEMVQQDARRRAMILKAYMIGAEYQNNHPGKTACILDNPTSHTIIVAETSAKIIEVLEYSIPNRKGVFTRWLRKPWVRRNMLGDEGEKSTYLWHVISKVVGINANERKFLK